jgi:Tol biopolymer transport system component
VSTFFIGFCIVCGMVIAARGDGGGGRIAFTSLRDGAQWEIYVMAGDGSHPANVTNHAAAAGAPAWSPSGTRIAFYVQPDRELRYLRDGGGWQRSCERDQPRSGGRFSIMVSGQQEDRLHLEPRWQHGDLRDEC